MAEDNAGSSSKPSWHERETALALQRLANARANLAQLEEQAAVPAEVVVVAPADLARADELEADIARLTAKAAGRFGGSGARAKLAEAERQLRELLERTGAASVEALRSGPAPSHQVDPTVLDFARRECADAEAAFLEVAAMVIPETEVDADHGEGTEAAVIAAVDSFGDDDLDLRVEPSAS